MTESPAQRTFADYYRCAIEQAAFSSLQDCPSTEGYFKFEGAVCYGRLCGDEPSGAATGALPSARLGTGGRLTLPFDLSQVVANLRGERYHQNDDDVLTRASSGTLVKKLYYTMRPLLGVALRRHLQKARLGNWRHIPFPSWPVETAVDRVMQQTMAALLRTGIRRIPFIWFWPDGSPGCAVMTHDVEGPPGLDFSKRLMDLDDSRGIKSSFQLVPESRGDSWPAVADLAKRRGFEVNIHDLNHDGYLFQHKDQFLERAQRINKYARDVGATGFRAGAMYRNQSWYDALEFSYDMSVPNVAHLEPQRGGCCTVMPYFVGRLVEIPLTMVQDYSLFFILGDYSTALWKQQAEIVLRHHGVMTFITHPDYLTGEREQAVYRELLAYIADLRDKCGVWVALPGEVDHWWRNRRAMTLSQQGETWRIAGPESHRARLAYATLEGDRMVYFIDGHAKHVVH